MANIAYIAHHGILGQKWGKKNGPPYPLSGGDYSREEISKLHASRKKSRHNIYNKKHFDQVIKEGTGINTLSYDANRTKGADMFYAAYDKADKHQYNALFNRKMPTDVFDDNGNKIGTDSLYKFRIKNIANNDIKVASEDTGAKAFIDLYSRDRNFSNFVRDPERMQAHFVDDKYKFKGYREGKAALERIRETDMPSEKDLKTAYRMFNYVIPSAGTDNRSAGDVVKNRTMFFNELKKQGYGACLDTNDAIYGGFKANAPVIMFDPSQFTFKEAKRVTTASKTYSDLVFAGRQLVKGLG